MSNRVLLSAICASVLAGCAQLQGLPSAESFESASLKKAKSAQHWDVIASDVAAQTKASVPGKTLYVDDADGGDFSRGFRSFLITRLVNGGAQVSIKPEGALKVSYETQVVRHNDDRNDLPRPGQITALAGGIYVAREISLGHTSTSSKVGGIAALTAIADLGGAYAKLHSPTNTEVIVTTSITDGGKYLMRKTDVYYVEDAEGAMFQPGFAAPIKTMAVVSK